MAAIKKVFECEKQLVTGIQGKKLVSNVCVMFDHQHYLHINYIVIWGT